jgi:hypothetical protein
MWNGRQLRLWKHYTRVRWMAGPSLFGNTILTEIRAAIRAGRQQLEAAVAAGVVTNVARNAESLPGAVSATGGLQAPNMLFGLPGGFFR